MDTSNNRFNYGEALQKSYLFYETQRSGELPENNRIAWRGDSTLDDGSDVGLDLTGGYFEAGNYIKFGFPMAASTTLLAWGIDEYKDAYVATGQLDEALDAIKWSTDYFLKAHITEDSETVEFWGQVGDPDIEHDLWQSVESMEVDEPDLERPSFKIDKDNPGSDLAAETAASLASAAIIFSSVDSDYAEELLENSKQLYEFAETYLGNYSDSIPEVQGTYTSSSYEDELAWGAIWLYKATGEKEYLEKAESYVQPFLGSYTIIWDEKTYGTHVLLAEETGKKIYRDQVEEWLDKWINGNDEIIYTDGGFAWRTEWGSLRLTANTAFLAGVYSDNVNDNNGLYQEFVTQQINYMLGDNPNNLSYQIGFGDNYPLNPHHRGSHDGSWETFGNDEPNANVLYGALVGGPKSPDDDDYEDSRGDWISNEATIDYNAGFTGALAYLYDKYGGDTVSDVELDNLDEISIDTSRLNHIEATDSDGESIDGGETKDLIEALEGDDLITAGLGKDTIYGNDGSDTIYGNNGSDHILGGKGNDILAGQNGHDVLVGDVGEDRIFAGGGNDSAFGGTGNDKIVGAKGQDYLSGGDGQDTLDGGDWSDVIYGNNGNDLLDGGKGSDLLDGGQEDDTLNGENGSDTINGSFGNDRLDGGNGNDLLGGDFLENKDYQILGNDTLLGGKGMDTLSGGRGSDLLRGQGSNDTLIASGINLNTDTASTDTFYGGSGEDIFDFQEYGKYLANNTRDRINIETPEFDLVVIKDFNVEKDSLIFAESNSVELSYRIVNSTSGTDIYLSSDNSFGEYRIAVIEGVDGSTLESQADIVYQNI